MAIKPTGQFVKRTETISGKKETWEEELQEVTCDVCGHKAVGTIGPFASVSREDFDGVGWVASNFYVRDPDFNVYDPNCVDKKALYWNTADGDGRPNDGHVCDNCTNLVFTDFEYLVTA